MSKEILQSLIENFDLQRFRRFFSEKNKKFRPSEDNLDYYCDDNFSTGQKLGELYLKNGNLLICAFKVKRELSERSGKKAQYNLGKAILKGNNFQQFNAGIFIFYDKKENFRFSLIYDIPKGIRRDWNNFHRFTYFVSKEFTNKTFLQRIGDGDFSSLDKIKDSFSAEKVTKEFYKDIANWYFWAVQNVKFPKDAEAEENGRNIAVIRLITRIIFIWFMRERGLVPRYLFDRKILNNIIKNTSPEKSTYYLAILQNLFFATLNTKKTERNFNNEWKLNKDNNTDYGDYNGYRYHELFKDSARIYEYFGDIPFLNGGLFECLDDKSNGIIIDGFSDKQKDQPQIPNYLFFSREIKADLNIEYGTKNKSYKVRGLIDTLSSYNFTIDENDFDDQEVALDPELLGRVFENLLASFNPETSTTARKATGSYYTPREIVNYMVVESLKQYFKTNLKDIVNLEEKLGELFSKNKEGNPFNEEESERIAKLIESLRIIDPAVGSGAFPMGVLNKLVFILSKIDPYNLYWKKVQMDAVKKNVIDSVVRQKLIDQIEKQFQEKNIDYGRKLFLIQKCIYGVDIQQIAVEIARLRFFISLLVNEKIDQEHPDGNCGVQPLPNLDFKIIQGNSLISEFLGIDFDKDISESEKLFSDNYMIKEIIKDFEQKKSDFQSEQDRNKKEKLKEDIEKLIIKILELKFDEKFPEFKAIEEKYLKLPNEKERKELILKEKKEFSKKIGFDLENAQKKLKEYTEGLHAKPFFLWKLYFAEVFSDKGGFDILITNPPYVQIKQIPWADRKIFKKKFISAIGRFNLFYFFLEISSKLVHSLGLSTFIVPDRLLLNTQCHKLRRWLLTDQAILEIDSFAEGVFEAVIDSIIIIYGNYKNNNKEIRVKNRVSLKNLSQVLTTDIPISYFLNSPNNQLDLSYNPKSALLLSKIKCQSTTLGEIGDVKDGIIQSKIPDILFLKKPKDNYSKRLLFGKDIARYVITFNNNWVNYKPIEMKRIELERGGGGLRLRKREIFERNKILTRQTADEIIASYDTDNYYYSNTLHGTCIIDKNYNPLYILGILNSKLITWYYRNTTAEHGKVFAQVKIELLKLLPIRKASETLQNPIIYIVEKILILTKSEDYLENSIKKEKVKKYENKIDQMVYKLYALTLEEIEIVKNSSKLI